MELRVSSAVTGGGIAVATDANDPVFKSVVVVFSNNVKRPQAWNISDSIPSSAQLKKDSLEKFYHQNLTRKQRLVDTKNKVITFRPEYYFIGLKSSAQTNNSTLIQTIGWVDSQKGGYGTFDPLAE